MMGSPKQTHKSNGNLGKDKKIKDIKVENRRRDKGREVKKVIHINMIKIHYIMYEIPQ